MTTESRHRGLLASPSSALAAEQWSRRRLRIFGGPAVLSNLRQRMAEPAQGLVAAEDLEGAVNRRVRYVEGMPNKAAIKGPAKGHDDLP
jgi:hypothetical protein